MNPLLVIGLALFAGGVFGYAACLWRWCSAEEALCHCRNLCCRGYGHANDEMCVREDGSHHPGFVVAHDCIEQGCRAPHGGVK